ncbi:MAG: DcaP family trimeric outer membrane transporter [Pseudomonadota bacterium]
MDLPKAAFEDPVTRQLRLVVATILVVTFVLTAQSQAEPLTNAKLQKEIQLLRAIVEAQARRIDVLEAASAEKLELNDDESARSFVVSANKLVSIGRFPDDAIVTTGDFPGSIRVPDQDGSVRIGGFVRADVVHDLESLGFEDLVFNRTIPLDGSAGDDESQTRLSARLSRISIDFRRKTTTGRVRTFIEADFFGGGDEFSSGYEFRLRHAAAQLGDFYLGQWWSSFSDVASFPEGSDFAGPLGKIVVRQPGIRWANDVGEGWRLGASVENPAGDLSGPDIALASDSVPDLIGYAQLTRDWGRVKLAGLGRRLETENSAVWAGGINLTGRFPVRFLGARDNIVFQAQVGEGITRYFAGFGGAGLDGIVSVDRGIEPAGVTAGYVAYQHWWNDTLLSTVTAGAMKLDLASTAAPGSFERGEYYSANLFWTPINGATFGFDVI